MILLGLPNIGCQGLGSGSHGNRFFSYDRENVTEFLKSNDQNGAPVWVRRNESGNKIYINIRNNIQPDEYSVVIIEKSRVSVNPSPGIIAFFNRNDELVAWSRDLKVGIRFGDEFILSIPPFAFFDIDASGRYFLIGEASHETLMGRVDQPELQTRVGMNFRGRRIFTTSGGLVIAGSTCENGEYSSACVFIEYGEGHDDFVVGQTVEFPSFSGVIDVSPDGRHLVLQGKSELFASWYLYEVSTGNSKRIRVATDFGFFLGSDLLSSEAR